MDARWRSGVAAPGVTRLDHRIRVDSSDEREWSPRLSHPARSSEWAIVGVRDAFFPRVLVHLVGLDHGVAQRVAVQPEPALDPLRSRDDFRLRSNKR
jgi:hypothetical protein